MGAALQPGALQLPASGTCGVSCRQCSKGLDEFALGRKRKGKFRRNALVRNGYTFPFFVLLIFTHVSIIHFQNVSITTFRFGFDEVFQQNFNFISINKGRNIGSRARTPSQSLPRAKNPKAPHHRSKRLFCSCTPIRLRSY